MNQTSTTFCERLVADGPDAEYADALNLFGQFIGSWDFTWRDVAGPETTGTGEWHFGWVLQGRAVQDVWIAYNADGSLYEYGTTIRCYNPLTGTWNVSWNGPVKGNLKTFVARKIGREIVLEGRDSAGHLVHWIFSGISEDAFRWRGEISQSNGITWTIYEEMQLTRRA
jgi:hypothetical protein